MCTIEIARKRLADLRASERANHGNAIIDIYLLHLDADRTVPFTRLASPALYVEGEASALPAADARLRQAGEEVSDRREGAAVGRRVAAWAASDRSLVDVDDLVDPVEADDAIVLAPSMP